VRRLLSFGAFTLAFLVMSVWPASAEPITLTSGTIAYSRQNPASLIRLMGEGISIGGSFGFDTFWNPRHACFDCTSGKMVNLSESFRPTDASSFAILTAGNVQYFSESVGFEINAGDFVIPNLPSGTELFAEAGPFQFRGSMSGMSQQGVQRTFDLVGAGRVRIDFARGECDGCGINWFFTGYEFQHLAPTPEPGPFVLLGTAVALGVLFRRHRAPN